MSIDTWNIVQAEFFHLPSEGSLEDVQRECAERAVEGSSIKTVVRFYDYGNDLTGFIQELRRIQDSFDEQHLKFQDAGRVTRFLLSFQLIRLRRMIRRTRGALCGRLARELQGQARRKRPIAVLGANDPWFRLALRAELHELCISANRASHVWVFVFTSNDLISDRNELVTAML